MVDLVAWTYSGDPTSSLRDQVRYLLGDTDSTDPQLQDAEITGQVTLMYPTPGSTANAFLVARNCALALAAKYSRQVTKSAGNLRVEYATRADAYRKLAGDLRRLSLEGATIGTYAGGISVADKQTEELNEDRVNPAFTRKKGSYPGSLNPPPATTPEGW